MQITNIKRNAILKLDLQDNYLIDEELLSRMEKAINPTSVSKKRSNIRLDALSLIKNKRINGIPAKDIPEGFIYIISNPAWPNYYKVGYSLDPRDRLASYQVGCPLGDYKMEGYYFSTDVREAEKFIHKKLSRFNVRGEWFCMNLENLRKFIVRHKSVIR